MPATRLGDSVSDTSKPFCIREHLQERLGDHFPVKMPMIPQVIDDVAAPEHQYAAAICETLDPDEIPHLEPHEDEDSARRAVRYISRQFQKSGLPDKTMLMRRTIHYGPWEIVTDE